MTGLIITIAVIAYVFLGCWCVVAAEAKKRTRGFLGVLIGPVLLLAGIIGGALKRLYVVIKGWLK